MSVDLNNYEMVFLSEQHAIALSRRGPDDPHVIVTILTEDDGNWFVELGGFSSFWLPLLVPLLEQADNWMQHNCDPDISDGHQYGWKLRP